MSSQVSVWGQLIADVLTEDDGSHDPREVTASSIGGCLRQSAWRLAGVPFSDDEPRHPSAAIGGAIHDRIADRIAARGLGVLIEHQVTHDYRGRSWTGRLDMYDAASAAMSIDGTGVLVDVKTCGDWAWNRAVSQVVPYEHAMQAGLYAIGCEDAGWNVSQLRWIFIHRSTGKICEIAVEWNATYGRAAVHRRLDEIIDAAADPQNAPREAQGIVDRGFSECNSCPFRTECWGPQDGVVDIGPHPMEVIRRADGLGRRYMSAREAKKSAEDQMTAARSELINLGVFGPLGATEVRYDGRTLRVSAVK